MHSTAFVDGYGKMTINENPCRSEEPLPVESLRGVSSILMRHFIRLQQTRSVARSRANTATKQSLAFCIPGPCQLSLCALSLRQMSLRPASIVAERFIVLSRSVTLKWLSQCSIPFLRQVINRVLEQPI